MSATYVRLTVGAEEYALPVEHVLELSELGDITPVPGSSDRILGVRNLRGSLLTVIDLAAVLGTPEPGLPLRLAVVEDGPRRAALTLDGVAGITELPGELEPTPSPLLHGAALVGGMLVGLLDVPAVLDAAKAGESG